MVDIALDGLRRNSRVCLSLAIILTTDWLSRASRVKLTSLGLVLRRWLLVLIIILLVIVARVGSVCLGGVLLVGVEVVEK